MGSGSPPPRNQPPPLSPSYRVVVVRPREPSRRRDFIWQIVRTKSDGATVMESASGSFKSMEDAYTQGTLALALQFAQLTPQHSQAVLYLDLIDLPA